jgi:hypothetical protein
MLNGFRREIQNTIIKDVLSDDYRCHLMSTKYIKRVDLHTKHR